MKRFFVMILLVSTFFIGLGSLIERGQASLKSDAKAQELVRLARIAIGGEANIANVRSMLINARTTHFFEKEGLQRSQEGSLEIAMQFPNQFSKMVRIGNPDEATGNGEIREEVRVVVENGGTGDIKVKTEGDSGKRIHRIKAGDGTWTDENGNTVKPGGDRKVIIKKDDGTVVQEMIEGGDDKAVWNTVDGKTVIVERIAGTENISGNRDNELLRTTFALLLTAPEGTDVAYTFAGEETVEGNACNIVLVQGAGSSFKLFLDKSTYLPRMVSYERMESPHIVKIKNEGSDDVKKAEVIEMKTMASAKSAERQLILSDFRSIGGLLLPFRWTESAGGRKTQTIDVTNFELNPANIADKFKGEKGFVRKIKSNQ